MRRTLRWLGLVLGLLLVGMPLALFAQSGPQALKRAIQDEGERYRRSDYRGALQPSGKALDMAIAIANRNGQVTTLHSIGGVHGTLRDYPKALAHFHQSPRIPRETGDSLGAYPKAPNNYKQSLKIIRAAWNDYKPSTLLSVVDLQEPCIKQPENKLVLLNSAKPFKSKVLVRYMGHHRPLSKQRALFYETYFTMHTGTPARTLKQWLALFDSEVLVQEGETKYWMLIQTPVLPYLKKEVPIGAHFTALVFFLGAVMDSAGCDWVFAINEFEAR